MSVRTDRPPPGTQGYAEQADILAARYEAIDFTAKHRAVLSLLPAPPASALDIGAGTGADAAWLAARGHPVVAVEPTAALRSRGMALHQSPAIEWVNDSLPALRHVVARRISFDLVLLTAVWMHLDADERASDAVVATLVAPRGLLAMALRHGPVPEGRLMFEVTADETIALAEACGLHPLVSVRVPSLGAENVAAGVCWSHLAFGHP